MQKIIVCESSYFDNGVEVCDSTKLVEGVILPPSADEQLNLLLNGGFSIEAAELGFSGVITLWVAGLTVGIIISQLRKLRV